MYTCKLPESSDYVRLVKVVDYGRDQPDIDKKLCGFVQMKWILSLRKRKVMRAGLVLTNQGTECQCQDTEKTNEESMMLQKA